MTFLSMLSAFTLATFGAPDAPHLSSPNWSIAGELTARPAGDMVTVISVSADGSIALNSSSIRDDLLPVVSKITKSAPGRITTLLMLRPGVTPDRRNDLIHVLEQSNACEDDDKCILVENWSSDFPVYLMPGPPTYPRK